jgi:hypothetical protein
LKIGSGLLVGGVWGFGCFRGVEMGEAAVDVVKGELVILS